MMKPISACIACRERRKKCYRARQGTSCTFCVKRGLECLVDYKPVETSGLGYSPLVGSEGSGRFLLSSAIVPEAELAEELVELYFRHVHISLPSLFHRPSFESAVKDGTIPKILFFGVMGLSARFSAHPSLADIGPWDRGRPYVREAERLLNIHDTSLITIQACLLLSWGFQAEGEANTASVYFAIASRMAILLDIPNAANDTPVEQEVHRRVWWSMVTWDTWHSAALGIPRTLKSRDDVPLPMHEWTFVHLGVTHSTGPDTTVDTPSPQTAQPSLSLLGYMIKLNGLLYEVNRLNTTLVAGSISKEDAEGTIQKLSNALEDWKSGLPPHVQYNESNLSHWNQQKLGPTFLSLHISYNNVGQLLFYQFLHFSRSRTELPTDSVAQAYSDMCKHHSANICKLACQARARPETELLYSLLGHILVVSSSVQLHTFLFNLDANEVAAARSRLERNFEILIRLHFYWPNVSISLNRLKVFHKACLDNRDSTFCLDRWMLQFILGFSRTLVDKDKAIQSHGQDLWTLDQLRYLIL